MKKINKKIWLMGLAFAAGLLWTSSALATDATLPFYAALKVRPNILFMLDTSGSMGWCIQCAATSCCSTTAPPNANYHVCGGSETANKLTCSSANSNRRIDIFRRVMTGTTSIACQDYSNHGPVYRGNRAGDLTVWDSVFAVLDNNTVTSPLDKILLVQVTAGGTYQLVSRTNFKADFDLDAHTSISGNQYYFVFKDQRDKLFPGAAPSHVAEPLNGSTGDAVYSLERFLMDYNATGATGGSQVPTGAGTGFPLGGPMVSLVNDGITGNNIKGNRYLFTPTSDTGAANYKSFNNLLTTNYYDQKRFYAVRLRRDTTCWYSCSNTSANCSTGTKTTRACYEPVPFKNPDNEKTLTYFVLMGGTDYKYMVLNADTLMLGATKPLTDFLDYYNAMNTTTWTSYSPNVNSSETVLIRQIFGDGNANPPASGTCYAAPTSTATKHACINQDGRGDTNGGLRTINQLVTGTPTGSVLIRPANTTIGTNITNSLGNVTYIPTTINANPGWPLNVTLRPSDTITGKEFYIPTSGASTRIDTAVRAGLDAGFSGADILYPVHTTLSSADIDNPWFGEFFGYYDTDISEHVWTGLTYKRLYHTEKGIVDNFPDSRYGLMIFDSGGGNTDFNAQGAQLFWNLAEGATNNIYIQEMIAQTDLNGDAKVVSCTSTPSFSTNCKITPSTSPGYNEYARQDILGTPSGNTPIAGALRDIVTYLYDHYFTAAEEVSSGNYGGNNNTALDTVPTMFGWWDWNRYGLNNYNGHILVNDPYYAYGCRKNNVIFLTDGGQTTGIPIGTGGYTVDATNLAQVETCQNRYVHFLVDPSTIPSHRVNAAGAWDPTKIYFIGVALGTHPTGDDKYAPAMLNSMAAASDLPSDPNDLIVPLMANSEEELNQALNWIMNKIMEGTFTRSMPTVNTNLTAGVAGYFDVNPDDFLWTGHLVYVDFVSTSALAEGSTTVYGVVDAASVLNHRTALREIFTSLLSGSTATRLEFTTGNASTLDDMLFISYPTPPTGYKLQAGTTLTGADVNKLIDFVRSENSPTFGDTANTPRTWKLGAIFHSNPMSMGPPPKDALPNVARYQAYATDYASAPEMVYVGALDGLLHAFFFMDPDGAGSRSILEEGFGYIPNYLLPSLYNLRMGKQEIYVDGDPNVGVMDVRWGNTVALPLNDTDICDTTSTPKRCWQTIVFSGLRDGGPAYFSLNVTDISTTTPVAARVKPRWEFKDPQGPNTRSSFLGASWSLPFVDEALYQPAGQATLDTRLILVFGGGKSIEGKSYEASWLYILDADEGKILRTFLVPDVTQHCSVSGQSPNLLLAGDTDQTAPTIHMGDCDSVANNNHNEARGNVLIKDIDLDEFPDWIYFGDMQGRMWKANIHDPDPAKWGICLFFDTGDEGYDNLTSISTQCNGDLRNYGSTQPTCADGSPSKRRPILYRPIIAQAPEGDGFILYFGTGHIEDSTESSDTTHINYIFAVKDTDAIDECHYGTLWGGSVSLNSNTPSAATGGWPIKLEPGEKIIAQPQIVDPNRFVSEISFQTYKPFEGTDVCKPGVSYKWQVDYSTGKGALCTLTTCTATGWTRKKATPGLSPSSLVLGDIVFTPIMPTTMGGAPTFTQERHPSDLLNGFYYWWVK